MGIAKEYHEEFKSKIMTDADRRKLELLSELLPAVENVLTMADSDMGGYSVPLVAMKKLETIFTKYKEVK